MTIPVGLTGDLTEWSFLELFFNAGDKTGRGLRGTGGGLRRAGDRAGNSGELGRDGLDVLGVVGPFKLLLEIFFDLGFVTEIVGRGL
ncbi:hypothetical protein SISNIDRAFT_452592 [Sistotremastrum niveocremeum HHB9708]|uniref:Uncharacterized protein n=1 Tax=Sistotremastrum niveocremeum HHB9708 TaxID=1314777 RepID=A0A164WPL0_9AGAM|nr:hypothetical protein SISNIDRAFT_452592 [Sistotremastrum niveocremeum HHB9708]